MPATIRQLETIDNLVEELGLEGALKEQVYAIATAPDARASFEVRELITGLIKRARAAKGQRDPAEAPSAPAAQATPGYYLRADGTAIVVVTNREGTRTYGKKFVPPTGPGRRPSWEYQRGLGISVAELTPMTAADAAKLGLSHGHCIKCCAPLGGASLSAAVSAKIGYGESCARNQGWPYPKGRAAQEMYLAAGIR